MKRLPVLLLALASAGCATMSGGSSQPAPAASAAAAASPRAPGGMRSFAEVTRGAELREGFFDSYQTADKLYLAIPADRFGEEFLMTFHIAQGIGARGLFGGTMLNIFEGSVVAFERHGDRVYLVQRPHRFTAPEGSPVEQAVDLSFSSSVLESAAIETVGEDSTVLIAVQDWFVSDLSAVGERVNAAVSRGSAPGRATFDRQRSHLESVKGFPENVNIRARLTFRPQQPTSINSVPDSRFVPVSVHYTLAKLPENPMTPRLADERVGYFITARKDFSRDDDEFFVRYVNRWRLEPSDPAAYARGELVEPVEPIVYYLEPNIPEEYRRPIAEAVEAWNEAFEEAGFRNAIRAEMLPEGADAEDIRYATIRWNTSDEPGYGAIGPSIVDPRTGEILDADILIEANMIRRFKQDWRTLATPATTLLESLHATEAELEWLAAGGEAASLGAAMAGQGALLRALLAARGELEPGEPVPSEYLDQAIKWVMMHEVGHTLGLRHNFRSSIDTPVERLYDREWTEKRGVFSSVMDYPTVNLSPDGRHGHFYNPGTGTYDRWAIAYGYTADPDRAAELARLSALPGHAYGTDEDARGPGALDPTVNVYDLGDDPLAWGRERARMVASLWPTLPEHVLADNERYATLTDAFNTLLAEYSRALAPAVKYIGGQYQYRNHVGDPNGRGPFVNVPVEKQREALEFLAEYALSEEAFSVPQNVLAQFGANRWSHWGEPNTYNGRIDYPFVERVAGLQRQLLEQLLQPMLFQRIRDAELRWGTSEVLTIPEVMLSLSRTVWSELWTGPRNVPTLRRDLQRAWLDSMTRILVSPPARMPADARAVARMRLVDLDQRLARALSNAGSLDAYTRAHIAESRARIAKALEAGLEAEGP